MSKEGGKASVFRTTKVRTRLRDDSSWMQQRQEAQAQTEEEKPWLAEVRARRLNGDTVETSPVSSPTTSTSPPTKSDGERSPTPGFLIRGVFTKLDKPAPPVTTNGVSVTTTQFTKKPSESYKKIAPHTVRPTQEKQEDQLSNEELQKRTEAASNVLKKSAIRQRSFVLSAAKKFESQETASDTSLVNSSPSFVAKRVEISDDDESAATPAPASTTPPSPVVPVTSAASAPEPKAQNIVDTSVKTAVDATINKPVAPKVEKAAPEPVKKDPPPVSVAVKDPVEGMKPGCTKVATPLPELIQAVCTEPKPKDSDISGLVDTPLVKLTPASPTPISLTPASPAPASTVPLSPAPVPAVTGITVKAEPEIAPKLSPEPRVDTSVKTAVDAAINKPVAPKVEKAVPEPVKKDPPPVSVAVKDPVEVMKPGCTKVATPLAELIQAVCTEPKPKDSDVSGLVDTPLVKLTPASPTPISLTPASPAPASTVPLSPAPVPPVTGITVKAEPEIAPKLSPEPRSNVDTLTTLSDTLISFGTSSTSFKDDEPVLAKKKEGSADSCTTKDGVKKEPAPELSNCKAMTDDLLALADGPEKTAEPVPPSPGRWSQDLLGGLDSKSTPAKTSSSLDLLANDVIPIKTEARSSTETVTITTKTVIITDKSEVDSADPWSSHLKTTVTESSSADPFDPYPIGTTSSNSSSDLLKPLADISINSVSPTYMKNKDPSPKTNISSNALESLADNVIPISTGSTRPSSQRSWARTWETSTPQQANTEESEEDVPGGQTVDQQTIITFERKSKENASPWDRWTSPTVYTVTTTRGEEDEGEEEQEEEEEESPEDTQTETVTTITTIREIHSNPQPAMDRYETYSRVVIEEEDRRVQTPEPEAKKGFVYVKEYVNATELSLHNARDAIDGVSDYLTSSFASSSYSSPSFYSSGTLSSACTFCGEPVDGDAKITIEHLNINCHPTCFKCGVCSKPMGDLLDSMFLHGGKVHCERCYSKALD
ncbi:zinc finger protein 185 isoform X2 [Sander lucioperca]|uniref:zinc finger protein 185 isoform X2 n=1 Tax=Sander lucioperca TaxID=283035 RepID=UPI001653979D|nr:zinc finger protein 185 isoform X2 [Sander lucioperca]